MKNLHNGSIRGFRWKWGEATEIFDVLFGSTRSSFEETRLCNVTEATDFILTHGDVLITEEDGTPLLETERGVLLYCNDMQYRDELMSELRRSEGFEERNWLET